jgi:uridine kinase
VLKVYLIPLLKTVKINEKCYQDARYLISFLDDFEEIPDEFVTTDSLLREFIGNSFFEE